MPEKIENTFILAGARTKDDEQRDLERDSLPVGAVEISSDARDNAPGGTAIIGQFQRNENENLCVQGAVACFFRVWSEGGAASGFGIGYNLGDSAVRPQGGTMAGAFEIKKSKDGQYYFHLKAANGEIILRSETYTEKASAKNGIESVKKNAADDSRYERKDEKNGKSMFNLKAVNHEVIGTSQGYASTSGREEGIASVKANAPNAVVHDETA
jgi:uncharacterized protein YegP (UPF0339 family)